MPEGLLSSGLAVRACPRREPGLTAHLSSPVAREAATGWGEGDSLLRTRGCRVGTLRAPGPTFDAALHNGAWQETGNVSGSGGSHLAGRQGLRGVLRAAGDSELVAAGRSLHETTPDAPDRDFAPLGRFGAFLAAANRMMAQADDERVLLQAICDMAVDHGCVALAWIGRPDVDGRLRVVAAAGRTAYLDGIVVLTDPSRPEGRGAAGRAWRQGVPQYVPSFATSPDMAPWQARAGRAGLAGGASLPVHRDGKAWAVASFYLEQGEFSAPLRALLEELVRDISQGLQQVHAQAAEQHLMNIGKVLLENTFAGIAMSRNRRIIMVTPHLARMLGCAAADELIGQPARTIYADVGEYRRVGKAYAALRKQGHSRISAVQLARRDGGELICDMDMRLVRYQGMDTVVWTVEDVTERHRLARELEQQAVHDPLTGLPNRRALEVALPRAIARAGRQGSALAVGVLDLDDFKVVNDSLGHEAGDRVLVELARRLTPRLRRTDFVARLGGDEFVLILEQLDAPAPDRLDAILARLHRAIEQPFEVVPGEPLALRMSLGLALYPADGEEGETLLRQADAALYQLKAHEHGRVRWWQRVSAQAEADFPLEAAIDPYGAAESELLGSVQALLNKTADQFVDKFYETLTRDAAANPVLASLDADAWLHLRTRQAEHMRFLTSPSTRREEIQSQGLALGRMHSLVGVDSALLSRAMVIYREILTEQFNHALLPARQRYRTFVVVERRLQDDLASELQAMEATLTAYQDALSVPLPANGARWADVSRAELETNGCLPGIALAILFRVYDDAFLVEHTAGSKADDAARVLKAHESTALDPADADSLELRTWSRWQTLTTGEELADPRLHVLWPDAARQLDLHSVLAIPILNAMGQPVAGVALGGIYPQQFESAWMRRFASGLQQRWNEVWRRCTASEVSSSAPQHVAQAYRDRLFAGGLRMHVQPVVDLRTGSVVQVEALARLLMSDGRIVPPGVFLPLLGERELAELFRAGLDQTLALLAAWERRSLPLSLSINLAPSTLVHPDCVRWVADALHRHGVLPQRLCLELLESHEVTPEDSTPVIQRLVDLGVRLAIDDLGSGYSSLRRLSMLPFHTVKIDRGLVDELRVEPVRALVLLDTLVEMGRRLGRDVVVEGLGDSGVIEAAALLGAPFGQGFGLARPMPAERLPEWAEGFTLTVDPGAIHTYLGGLVYHRMRGHADSLPMCPFTHLLAEKGMGESPAARWHAQLHTRGSSTQTSDNLLSWLLDRVQLEQDPQHGGQG